MIFHGSLFQDIIGNETVNIIASKPHVTPLAMLDELPTTYCQHGQVKGTSAKIKDKDRLCIVALNGIHSKGNGGGCRLGKQPADL